MRIALRRAPLLTRAQYGSELRESFYTLAPPPLSPPVWNVKIRGIVLDTAYCLRCNREITPGTKSVSVYMFAQTVGIRPRQKSTSQRVCFCPQCSVSLALGPPPEGALNIVAWNMIRDLVSSDPSLSQAAWEGMHDVVGLLPSHESDPAPRRAVAGGLLRVLGFHLVDASERKSKSLRRVRIPIPIINMARQELRVA